MVVLVLRKNHGNEMERARDLFYALWIPDLFMKRVEAGVSTSISSPPLSCSIKLESVLEMEYFIMTNIQKTPGDKAHLFRCKNFDTRITKSIQSPYFSIL